MASASRAVIPPQPPQLEIPPFVVNLFDFFHHFVFFFLFPLVSILLFALIAAVLVIRLRRALFGRYATPEELLDGALRALKKDGGGRGADGLRTCVGLSEKRSANFLSKRQRRETLFGKWEKFLFSTEVPRTSFHRKRALDDLRLVMQLHPEPTVFMKASTALATELLYGEISSLSSDIGENGGSNARRRKVKNISQGRQESISHGASATKELKFRHANQQSSIQTQEQKIYDETINNKSHTSAQLRECQEVIKKGLAVDPKNEELIKLKTELQIVMQYGMTGVHVKMMNIGSFGWTG